jgi:hypothetical protein
MKTMKRHWTALNVTASCGLLIVATALTVLAQTAPVLTMATTGTNQLLITITNGVGATTYDIYTAPVLGDTVNYPWTAAVVGTNGQTNFTVTMLYPNSFYRAVVDTNGVPIWAAADPNNPGAGYLAVFIDTPVNGSNLTQ